MCICITEVGINEYSKVTADEISTFHKKMFCMIMSPSHSRDVV